MGGFTDRFIDVFLKPPPLAFIILSCITGYSIGNVIGLLFGLMLAVLISLLMFSVFGAWSIGYRKFFVKAFVFAVSFFVIYIGIIVLHSSFTSEEFTPLTFLFRFSLGIIIVISVTCIDYLFLKKKKP